MKGALGNHNIQDVVRMEEEVFSILYGFPFAFEFPSAFVGREIVFILIEVGF